MTFTKKQLTEIKRGTDNRLTKDVINTLLDQGTAEDIKMYVEDLLQYGCQSGMVGSLIYYTDTVKFYKRFKDEINSLLKEMLFSTGFTSPAELFGDKWDSEDIFAEEINNQSLLAWFGFEETVRKIAYNLEMEI